jgi:hypothetical protein
MTQTVEDAIEILAGVRPRIINIRIDYNEKTLIKSIGRQVANGLALTDRQLELSLKKIKKYQENLEKNNINVEELLLLKSLRHPLREIDRSQSISLVVNDDNKQVILIKGTRAKTFQEKWPKIQEKLVGTILEQSMSKEIPLNELNIVSIVPEFINTDFQIDEELLAIYKEIEKILENPQNFVPYIDLDNDKIIVRNANKHCLEYIDSKISEKTKTNFLSYIDKLKQCGVYHKNPEICEKIRNFASSELVKSVLTLSASRFRISPETYAFDEIVDVVEKLDQWPVLVLVDDDNKALEQVTTVFSALNKKIPTDEITVFFRIDNGQKNADEFNQMVKDNHLNNYIGPNTKVVFIAKNKIPKPLLKADWHPITAIILSNYNFGKTSAFLDDMSTVYYYNNSVAVRNNRIKGARQIAQL